MNPIVVVAGTRPEHLKVAEVIRELRGCGRTVVYAWTGQHTSPSLAADIFAATDGPYPDVVLPWPTVKARSGRPVKMGRASRRRWCGAPPSGRPSRSSRTSPTRRSSSSKATRRRLRRLRRQRLRQRQRR